MTKKKDLIVVRKATKRDLEKLNERYSMDGKRFNENDLERLIVIEVNGKVAGIKEYNPNTHNFFDATNDPIIKYFIPRAQQLKAEGKKKKNNLQNS